jgi:hypothetical protein
MILTASVQEESDARRCQSARLAACLLALLCAVGSIRPVAAEDLPPNFQAAVADFLAGNYKQCQIGFGRAVAEAPRAGLAARAAYGAACCAALRNDTDGGFEALSLALANGFRDLERALSDPRLDTLRSDPRWVRFVALTQERLEEHQKSLDPDLLRLYLEQQQDRSRPADAQTTPALVEAAARRRSAAWALVEQGRAKRADDAFHAASLLVESDRQEEVARAADLARQALASDPDLLAVRPLVATAVDRAAMLAGRPQPFGTQLVEVEGQWQVYNVDPAVTDDERAEWGLPPIAEARARAADLNRAPAKPAAPAPKP